MNIFPSRFNNTIYPVFIILISLAITFSRQPDAFLYPQLYAEDGVIWITQAYHEDFWNIIFRPQDGYYNILARLSAEVALPLHLKNVPQVFFFIALVVHLIPVILIFSNRLSHVFLNLKTKLLFSFFYLALPDVSDLHLTLANAHWRFAIITFLIFISRKSHNKGILILALSLMVFGSLTGPFSIFLLPCALIYSLFIRDRFIWTRTFFLLPGLILQLYAIISSLNTRPILELGASPEALARIISGKVLLSLLLGYQGYKSIYEQIYWNYSLVMVLAIITFALTIYGFIIAKIELKLFILYTIFLVITALIKPTIGNQAPAWIVLENPAAAPRYWLQSHIAFFSLLMALLTHKTPLVIKSIVILMLSILPLGIYLDWRLPTREILPYKKSCRVFNKAQSGTEVTFPIQPPGYEFRLTKK